MQQLAKQGTRIHASIKKVQMEKFKSVLKENHLYLVQNFIVAENTFKYKTVNRKFKIIFVGKTRVTEIFDDNFPWKVYNFKEFEDLSNAEEVDETILIDVIGKLVSRFAPQYKEFEKGQAKMLDIVLENARGKTISCTLWESYVDDMMKYLETKNESTVIIVLLQFCRQKIFMGEVRLSNTYHITKLIINEDIREIVDFRASLISDGNSSTPFSNVSLTQSNSLAEDLDSSKDLFRTIEQISEIEEVGSFWTLVKIVAVESITDWWYVSCKKCPRKMTPAAGKFYCVHCDCFDSIGKLRYKLQVRVMDSTGNAPFLLWDRECKQLIGKTAYELKNNYDDQILPKEIQNLVDMHVLFKVQIRPVQYGPHNDSFTVIKLTIDKPIIGKYCGSYFYSEESDMFSKLKEAVSVGFVEVNSSEDEVSTLIKDSKKKEFVDVDQDVSFKRSLNDEFSSTSKDKKLKVDIKIEKE